MQKETREKSSMQHSQSTLSDTSAGKSAVSGSLNPKDEYRDDSDKKGMQTRILTGIPEKGKTENTANEKPDIRPVPAPDKTEMLPDERINKNNESAPVVADHVRLPADMGIYQNLLQKYVSATGKVNYTGLKRDMHVLEKFTAALSDDPSFEKGSVKEKLALWINTYNAYTLLMVVRHYPVNSIRDLHGGKPWDAVWIRIGKKNYSLNQIENDIIRPLFEEPRIHFVLNCAASSCPPLLNIAFTPENLESMMEKATKNFINSHQNIIREDRAEISSVFDWYRDDFGNLISFLNRYSNIKLKEKAKISYMKYDWSLND